MGPIFTIYHYGAIVKGWIGRSKKSILEIYCGSRRKIVTNPCSDLISEHGVGFIISNSDPSYTCGIQINLRTANTSHQEWRPIITRVKVIVSVGHKTE